MSTQTSSPQTAAPDTEKTAKSTSLAKSVVLVGLMGAGKSAVGRRLAARLGQEFIDADAEIEKAADCTIDEIFQREGEAAFRIAERRIIHRLLTEHPAHVLATGGGAFMDPETRRVIAQHGRSVWLRADLDVLLARTSRRNNRPLLKKGDPKEILQKLMDVRYPVYAEAEITVNSDDQPVEETVERVAQALAEIGA